MNCECTFVDMPSEITEGSAESAPFLRLCSLHQLAADRFATRSIDARSGVRRRAGSGTVEPRGRLFLARLPDDARTSMGTYGTRDSAERALDFEIARLRAVGRLFGTFLCVQPTLWPDHGGVYVISTPSRWPVVKIGRSAKLVTRLRDLSTDFGHVGLLAVLSHDPEDEPVMHARFAAHHEHGEWFRAEGSLLEAITEARSNKSSLAPPRTG